MQDLKNDIAAVVALNPTDISTNTTTDGNSIDMQGYDSLTFLLSAGTVTDGTYTPIIEESDTGDFSGEETAVADADLIGTEANMAFSAADDNAVKTLGYTGSKRYVRFTLVSASTSTGVANIGCIALKGHPHVKKDTTNEDAG